MSDRIEAQVEEVNNGQEETKIRRKLVLEMIFTEAGIEINTQTNLSPLEQIGAIKIFESNILNQNSDPKENAQ